MLVKMPHGATDFFLCLPHLFLALWREAWGLVIPWLKRKTDEQEREALLRWVEIAVAAAQQLYHQKDGAERKAYVLDFLESKGYRVDTAEIDSAIEAAVLKLHEEMKHGN